MSAEAGDGVDNEYTRYIKNGVVQEVKQTGTEGGDIYDKITDVDLDRPIIEAGTTFVVPVERSESTVSTNLGSKDGTSAGTYRGPGFRHDYKYKAQSQAIQPMDFDSPFFAVGVAAKLLRSKAAEGVVYLRSDLSGGLKPYVGQAKSEARFLARQAEHARKHPNSDFKFEIIDRGSAEGKFPTILDIKEQRALDRFGGPTNKSNPYGGTSNAKNVIRKKTK